MKSPHNTPIPFALMLSLCVAILSGWSCKHDHNGEHLPGNAGHDHGAPEDELPTQSITVWSDHTELFMEYDPLVAGRTSRFAAHLTTSNDLKPLTSGSLSLLLECEGGTELTAYAQSPSSPGILRFPLSPTKAGTCKMSLFFESLNVSDSYEGGMVKVFADSATARNTLHDHPLGEIKYTKEQQWRGSFATSTVELKPLQPSVGAVATVRPMSGREARITAPARGRVSFSSEIPLPGMNVEKGQILATLSPFLAAGGDRSTLEGEAQSAKAEHAAAKAQLERLERLLAEQAVPQSRVEDARTRLSVAKALLDSRVGRLNQFNRGAAGITGRGAGTFKLRSPIGGTLVQAKATSGDSVEDGELLFQVIDLSRIWLQARIFEPDIPQVESATSAWFTVEGYDAPFTIDESNGRLITVGHVIDPQSRTVPVIFEMDNPGGRLRIGQFAKVNIATGAAKETFSVPTSAILNDAGKKVVFVQVSGERFTRRVVQTGIESGGLVEVLSGVESGELVVSKGAYEVRLAGASESIPDHGHVH